MNHKINMASVAKEIQETTRRFLYTSPSQPCKIPIPLNLRTTVQKVLNNNGIITLLIPLFGVSSLEVQSG